MNVTIQRTALHRRPYCSICCLIFCLTTGLMPSVQAQEANARERTPAELHDWEYHWGDAPLDSSGTPVWTYESMPLDFWQPVETIELYDGHPSTAWIRTRLPNDLPGSAVLATDVVATSFDAYVDRMLIFQFGTFDANPANKYGITTAQMIPLHLSVFSLSMGLFYIGTCFFVLLILPAPAFWYYAVLSLVLFPVGMLGFLEQVMESHSKRLIRRLWQIHLVSFCVVLLLDVLNVSIIPSWFMVFFLLLTVSVITSVVVVLREIRSSRREVQIFGIGMLVILFSTSYDMVVLGFFADQTPVSQWGVIIFLLFLGYLLAHQFAETNRQLTRYSAELEARSQQLLSANTRLEEYSDTLARKVEERTMELAKKNTELTEKNEALDHTLQRLRKTQQQLILQEKMASLGQLTAGIAHEIKNPLNFVNNFAELMGELVDELGNELHADLDDTGAGNTHQLFEILADLKSNAEKTVRHGKRADSVVSAMMQHALSGTGRREPTDVNTLLNEYINLAYHGKQAQLEGFACEIERSFDVHAGTIEVDRRELGRVFLNLLSNAFDAVSLQKPQWEGDEKAVVHVSTRRLEDAVEIRVTDNGPGIPAAIQEKIFEPFFTTKPTGSGTGLGLSLSYDIVTQGHGGTLRVESTEENGASFIVTLPDAPNA